MLFFDPGKPLATCQEDSCRGCGIKGRIHCHFRLRDWLLFLLVALPCFVLGGVGINSLGSGFLAVWIILVTAFFGFVEIRVLCSHCPHYAESSSSLRCWANYGSPKLWRYRPGPMSGTEKSVFLGGLAVVWGYPLVFLILGGKMILLAAYALSTAAFFLALSRFMCSRCMNFACPLNRVKEQERSRFLEKNPRAADGWPRSGGQQVRRGRPESGYGPGRDRHSLTPGAASPKMISRSRSARNPEG